MPDTLRVAALTGGTSVPSARFRVRQLIAPLGREGIVMEEMPASLSAYPPASKALRPLWLGASLCARLPQVLSTYRYDAVFLQRELLSTLYTLERFTHRPRVFDVDDAIWLHPRGAFAARLAAACDAVICGNAYLADYFSRFNHRVSVVPTAVDTAVFVPAPVRQAHTPVVGWVGTAGNFRYLYHIEPALKTFLDRVPEAQLWVMAESPPALRLLPADRVVFRQWAPDAEVAMIQGLTVGIMPLEDSEWARGKCSFKMLSYMSCAVPVVVSPVGMNREVLARGSCGYGADSDAEWVEALESLCLSPDKARAYGECGRAIVERHYSTGAVTPQVAEVIRDVTHGR